MARLLKVEGEPPAPQIFANPEIVERSDERSTYEEGCLSIPDYYAEVERLAIEHRAADNIIAVLQGQPPADAINRPQRRETTSDA